MYTTCFSLELEYELCKKYYVCCVLENKLIKTEDHSYLYYLNLASNHIKTLAHYLYKLLDADLRTDFENAIHPALFPLVFSL